MEVERLINFFDRRKRGVTLPEIERAREAEEKKQREIELAKKRAAKEAARAAKEAK